MEKAYRILAINPGSTSTKIAIFTNEEMTFSRELKHSAEDLTFITSTTSWTSGFRRCLPN